MMTRNPVVTRNPVADDVQHDKMKKSLKAPYNHTRNMNWNLETCEIRLRTQLKHPSTNERHQATNQARNIECVQRDNHIYAMNS